MARIRYIKPEFFEDEILSDLSAEARLLYIGLWCWMDRQGVTEDSPKLIKRNVFPFDDRVTVERVDSFVRELVEAKKLVEVKWEGKSFLFCPSFAKHQKLHPGEKSKYAIPRETLLATSQQPTGNLLGTYPQPPNHAGIGIGTGTGIGIGTGTGTGIGTGMGTGEGGPEDPLVREAQAKLEAKRRELGVKSGLEGWGKA